MTDTRRGKVVRRELVRKEMKLRVERVAQIIALAK